MARRPISLSLRFSVYERDKYRCQYCGRQPPEIVLQLDHVYPVALGGQNKIDNLLTACRDCNIGKGARDPGLSMPGRPLTPLEKTGLALSTGNAWAMFFPTAAWVRALLFTLVDLSTHDHVVDVGVANPAELLNLASEDVASVLSGLCRIDAARSLAPDVYELRLSRGYEYEAAKWSLGGCSAPHMTVAQVH